MVSIGTIYLRCNIFMCWLMLATLLWQAMARLIFPRGAVCGWTEPPFAAFEGPPRCVADPDTQPPGAGRTLAGRWFRVPTCELRYGPFNCNFVWKVDNWCVAPRTA